MKNLLINFILLIIVVFGINITTTIPVVYGSTQTMNYEYDVTDYTLQASDTYISQLSLNQSVNTQSAEYLSTNVKPICAYGGTGVSFFKNGFFNAPKKGTEVVQRAMSRAELEATRKTGLLRGGREGTHYVSDAVNTTAKRARQRLGLPVEPEVRVTMEVPKGKFSPPSRVQPFEVQPGKVLPGGGMERTATGDIPVKILDVREY